MKSDGNGGLVIKKTTLAAIALLITVLSIVGTVVAYGVTVRSDVDNLQEGYNQIIADSKEIETNVALNKNTIITNQEKIIALHSDIKEIKSDVKELIAK